MHFRILKMIATRGFLTALECTKFVFGRGSAPNPAGKLTALPSDPPSWFKEPSSKGKRKERSRGKRTEGGEEVKAGKGRGRGTALLRKFLDPLQDLVLSQIIVII